MRSIRRIFVISCVLIFAGLIWAGVYARKQGFTNSWRQAVEDELAEQGYFIDIGKLTLGAFRGLVAEDVKFFRDETRKMPFAEVSDIYLDVGLDRIWQKEVSINTLDIQKGKLTIPLEDEDNEQGRLIQITKLSGRIALTESRVEIVKLEANFAGVEVLIKGSLLRSPNQSNTVIKSAGKEAFAAIVTKIRSLKRMIDELENFEFPEGPPTLLVDFEGDLSDLSHTSSQAVFKAGRFRKKKGDYEVTSLDIQADLDGRIGQIKIPRFRLIDKLGLVDADGVWTREANALDFDATSNADLINLLEFFFPNRSWGEVVFYQAPTIRVEGSLNFDLIRENEKGGLALSEEPAFYFPGQVLGEFQTDGFVISGGSFFTGSSGEFSVKEAGFYLRNIRADHKSGVAFLNCKFEPRKGPDSLQFQSAVKMDPRVFAPVLKDEDARQFLSQWSFDDKSEVHLEASGQCSSLDLAALQARGVIDLRNFKLNEIPFQELGTQFEINGAERWYRDVKLKREDGEIEAALVYTDSKKKLWEIKGGSSNVNLAEAFGAFSPALKERLSPYRFTIPPVIKVQGTLDARTAAQRGDSESFHDLEISFTGFGAVHYPFLGKELPLNAPVGTLLLKKDETHLSSFKAGLCGGNFEMESKVSRFQASDFSFDNSIKVEGINLKSLGGLYGIGQEASGVLHGTLKMTGRLSEMEKIAGSGQVSVSDRDLFQIPLFKDLEDLLVTHEGHLRDHKSQEKSRITFQIKEGIAKSSSLTLLSGTLGLSGMLEINLSAKTVAAELNPARGGSSRIYRCRGTLAKPEWKAEAGQKITIGDQGLLKNPLATMESVD